MSDDKGQMSLVDMFGKPAWTPASDNDTSLEAAASVSRSGKADKDRLRVLDAIESCPGTDTELSERLGIEGNSLRPRRGELARSGYIQRHERRRVQGRRPAWAWSITDKGRAVLRGERGRRRAE